MPQKESWEALENIIVEELWNPESRTLYLYTPNKSGESDKLSFRPLIWERHWQKLGCFWNSLFVCDTKRGGDSERPSFRTLMAVRYNITDGQKLESPYKIPPEDVESKLVNAVCYCVERLRVLLTKRERGCSR